MVIMQREELNEVYSKIGSGWLELGALIGSLEREGEDVDSLRKVKEAIGEGLDTFLYLLKR